MNATLEYIVKKFNLDLGQTNPIQLPSIGRQELAELFAELNFNEGVEIGVDRGAYSEMLCKLNPKLHLYSVDPWEASFDGVAADVAEGMKDEYEAHYRGAARRLSAYNCEIIRDESRLAAKKFANDSLDFVYIDANHDFVNVTDDIHAWEKKVKNGGIVSGHDYFFSAARHTHVKYAVDSYALSYEIAPYFELGRDRYHSWFWVKE